VLTPLVPPAVHAQQQLPAEMRQIVVPALAPMMQTYLQETLLPALGQQLVQQQQTYLQNTLLPMLQQQLQPIHQLLVIDMNNTYRLQHKMAFASNGELRPQRREQPGQASAGGAAAADGGAAAASALGDLPPAKMFPPNAAAAGVVRGW
jgi:hypothetical protein